MAFEFFEVDSSTLSTSKHCRLDQKYTSFTQIKGWKIFETKLKQLKLSDFLEELPIKKYAKGDLDDEFYLVNISDQQQRHGELENVEIVDEIGSDKNCLSGADIIISKLGMPKGYIFLNTFKEKNVLGSTEFISYKIRDQKFTTYLKYILLHPKSLKAYAALESGKTPSHKRVNPYEFLKIQIPLPSKPSEIVAQIKPIEQKIKDLNNQIKKPQEVINQVFVREFGFDLEGFEKSKAIKDYFSDLASFANNKDIRQSVKFHRPVGKFVLEELKRITNKKIKDFISEPIVLGSSISPKDFDETNECSYVGMSNIKNWCLGKDSLVSVSKKFEEENKKKTIAKNDIIFARSGEGTIGKCALIEDDEVNAIFADFTMRVRLKNYNQRFAYYFFRTTYFQVLIEINKKGLGNNTNIFPSQIRELPIIDISLARQQEIVDEIKLELDSQEEIKKQIISKRQKIDSIIEQSISS